MAKRPKRKKLTQDIIDGLLQGKLAIWIWAAVEGQEDPIQIVFPGQVTLYKCYPERNSYFEAPNADDKFYYKEYDYFWFVCKNEPPKQENDSSEA